MINKIMCGVEESLHKKMAIVMAKKTLHMFWKNPNVENETYKSHFDNYVTVLEAYAGRITVPPDLVDGKLRELYPSLRYPKNVLSHQREAATEAAKEKYLACMLLAGSKNAKFGDIKDELSNSYLIRDNHYPNNREGIVSITNNWKGSNKQQPTTTNNTTVQDEVEFVQKYAEIDDKNGKRVNAAGEEKCHHYGKRDGHWIYECPDISP